MWHSIFFFTIENTLVSGETPGFLHVTVRWGSQSSLRNTGKSAVGLSAMSHMGNWALEHEWMAKLSPGKWRFLPGPGRLLGKLFV